MLIECTLKRAEPIIIPIGSERYEFKPDAKGRNVAEVWIESHIECFLAVSHLYRKVDDDPGAEADDAGAPAAAAVEATPEAKPEAGPEPEPVAKPPLSRRTKGRMMATTSFSPA